MPNFIGNLLFEHLSKFQAYSSSVCKKVESQFFFRKGILQIKWVSFYNLNVFFMTNLICPLLSFMFNFIHSSSTFLVQETASKKKTGRIILIHTWLDTLLHKQQISKIKHNSPDSIQKHVEELIC